MSQRAITTLIFEPTQFGERNAIGHADDGSHAFLTEHLFGLRLCCSVQGRSEREWGLILDEWRKRQRVHQRKHGSLDSVRLAVFLEEMLTNTPSLRGLQEG